MATCQTGKTCILYDPDSLSDASAAPQIGPSLFDPNHWKAKGAIVGQAPGRGATLFLAVAGAHWVLRPYCRGGLVAHLSHHSYLWTGLERTRAFREMRLTAELFDTGLPVPRPVAAAVTRHRVTYTAGLITLRIPGARALANLIKNEEADEDLLERVGFTIRRFHDAGLDHVDLNARNLLVDERGKVWLIDLDRCKLRPKGIWQTHNLARLERSLAKFAATDAMQAIRKGYAAAGE